MDRELLTRQNIEDLQRGATLMVGAITDGLRRLAQAVEPVVGRISAHFQAASLEAQGRKCKYERAYCKKCRSGNQAKITGGCIRFCNGPPHNHVLHSPALCHRKDAAGTKSRGDEKIA